MNLQLFYTEQFSAGQPIYRIAGTANFTYPELRSFPQYSQSQNIRFCVSSSNPYDPNTPIRGSYSPWTGQIAIKLTGTFPTTFGFSPQGGAIQGQDIITVELGTIQGCTAIIYNGGIEGCAYVQVGQQRGIPYSVTSTSGTSGGSFGGKDTKNGYRRCLDNGHTRSKWGDGAGRAKQNF